MHAPPTPRTHRPRDEFERAEQEEPRLDRVRGWKLGFRSHLNVNIKAKEGNGDGDGVGDGEGVDSSVGSTSVFAVSKKGTTGSRETQAHARGPSFLSSGSRPGRRPLKYFPEADQNQDTHTGRDHPAQEWHQGMADPGDALVDQAMNEWGLFRGRMESDDSKQLPLDVEMQTDEPTYDQTCEGYNVAAASTSTPRPEEGTTFDESEDQAWPFDLSQSDLHPPSFRSTKVSGSAGISTAWDDDEEDENEGQTRDNHDHRGKQDANRRPPPSKPRRPS